MPVVRPYGGGGISIASPPCNLRRTITLSADVTLNLTPLLVEGFPHLFFWVLQTSIVAPASIQLQWSARSVAGFATPTDDWQPLMPAQFALPGNVVYGDRILSAKRYRMQLTRAAGVATTLEIFYGGTVV